MSNRTKSHTGFTLIELLVVIAIIGILAALVLVALGNARQKANDARVQSNLGNLRKLAEGYYDANGASYGGLAACITTPNPTNCKGGIEGSVTLLKADNNVAANNTNSITPAADVANYCLSSPLSSSSALFICIDATGVSKKSTGQCPTTGTPVCP